jgi:class 3 adenylate cyclase
MTSTIDPRATPRLRRLVEALARLGATPDDPEPLLVQKATVTVAAVTIVILSVVWVGTYLALGLPVSAAIPFSYQVVTLVALVVFARTKDVRPFRFSQIVLMVTLPFVLQWSLGGYVASSAVSLWALIAVFGALFFYGPTAAVPWFLGFLVLTLASGLAEPLLAAHAARIPPALVNAFFVLNVVGVSLTAYLLLQYAIRARDAALASSERLLLNVLPAPIARRLKRDSGLIADAHDDVTVLFADMVDFTPFTERTAPDRLIEVLDQVFTAFDQLAERFGLEKIKTIGDAYMAVSGLPAQRPDHAEAAADMALAMRTELAGVCTTLGLELRLRIGLQSGPVVAGVIGRNRFIYDLWGDTVNTASRMEATSLPDRIQVTEEVHRRLSASFAFEPRGEIDVKGKGSLRTYFLTGRLSPVSPRGGREAGTPRLESRDPTVA